MNTRAKFLWSVRRELWEHRSIWIAPAVVAAVVLVAFLFNMGRLGRMARLLPSLDAAKQLSGIVTPFGLSASVIMLTSFLVAMFYCLDALYGERRDRSILFWKSMPVSDFMTVGSKAAIPFVVLPLVAFTIVLATHFALLALAGIALTLNDVAIAPLWSKLPLFEMWVSLFYGMVVHTLWYAPLYGWLMLVSAWAKKAPSLWAVVPFLVIVVAERIALDTHHFATLIQYRVTGGMGEAFGPDAMKTPIAQLSQLEPVRFLTSMGLWTGLVAAAVFFAAAIWMRRRGEPI